MTPCRLFRRRSFSGAELVLLQHLRNLRPGRAAILVPLSIIYAKKPFKKIASGAGHRRALRRRPRRTADLHLRWDQEAPRSAGATVFLFLPTALTHWFERIHIRPLRNDGHLKKAEKMDAGALREVRRPGRHLPGHDERASSRCKPPRLLGGRPAVHPRHGRVRKARHRQCPNGEPTYPTPTFRMQPCFSAGLGYGARCSSTLWARRGISRQTHPQHGQGR